MPFTNRYYPKLQHFNQNNGIWGLVRWLLDDQTTVAPNGPTPGSLSDAVLSTSPAGPGWKLVECRSNGGRYQPGSPTSGDGTLSGIVSTGEGVAHNWRLGATQAVNQITVTGGSASPGDTVTINGIVLTAVNGARTPGADDFDVSSGVTSTIVADMVAAINDPLNSFTSTVTAVDNDPDVELTAVVVGPSGNALTLATSNATAFGLTEPTFFGVLEADDWIVLETDRETALGATAQATASITPATGASSVTILINGIALTGVSGARTSGADDFDMSLGTVAALTAEITAAINDGANSFSTTVTATDNGTNVGLTADATNHPGTTGNLLTLSVTSVGATYTVSGPVFTGGNFGEECQLMFAIGAANDDLLHLLIPLADWTTFSSNDPATSLTLPTASVGDGLATFQSTTIPDTTFDILAVADEGMLALFWNPNRTDNLWFQYWGDVDNPNPSDSRPFIVRLSGSAGDESKIVNWQQVSFSFYWRRISPVDNTTLVTGHESTSFVGGTFSAHIHARGALWGLDSRLGTRQFFPVGVIMATSGHEHWAGWLKNIYEGHNYLGLRGSSGARDFIWLREGAIAADNNSTIVMAWDGITEV